MTNWALTHSFIVNCSHCQLVISFNQPFLWEVTVGPSTTVQPKCIRFVLRFLKLLAKSEAIDRLDNYKVTKEEISSNNKFERPDGPDSNHFALSLKKQFVIFP